MGRRKRDVSTSESVKSFTETKEDSIAVFSKKKEPIAQEVIDSFEVKPVGRLSKLGGDYIIDFNGKDYRDSLVRAYDWKDRCEKENNVKITFVNYYPQEFMSKNILISYNIKEKKI